MRFGLHLPLIGFTEEPFSLERLLAVTRAARRHGFDGVAANDHLVFGRPWLDGLAALAAVASEAQGLSLATTVALPVVRGPVATAKAAAAVDILSGGRLVLGVGPGSSAKDYQAVGLDFEERWQRLDDVVPALRALFTGGSHEGRFYQTAGVDLAPRPLSKDGPPIWIGSWGSEAGLRRVARLADGWLASAYNTTPQEFGKARERLDGLLEQRGRNPSTFPDALATTIMYLTRDGDEAKRMLEEVVARAITRPFDQLRERLLVCSPDEAVEKVSRYAEAGLQMMYLWPVTREAEQAELFATEVAPKFAVRPLA